MLLKNKKTGEIGDLKHYGGDGRIWVWIDEISKPEYRYNSLAELNAEWEDVPEEPKKHYEILAMGAVMEREDAEDEIFRNQGQRGIGNYFSSREEAELAVRRLKAWKRLKDKGFEFDGYDVAHKSNGNLAGQIFYDAGNYSIEDVEKEMNLLFSQEDD